MSDDLDEEKGEMMGFEDPNGDDVTDTDDGGALVKVDDLPKRGDSTFYENLADHLTYPELNRLATDLTELIERDKKSREKRDKQYEEGIRRTGLGDDAPGGASFEGASKVVHPLLTEVCVDFSSRVVKELCPPDGPVKSKIVGDLTQERVAKGQRKSDFMNWQLTVQSPNFRAEMEQLFTQVPLGGAQYLKVTWNEARNRPEFAFVPIDDMFLPYAATSFYTSQRKTHRQYITKLEYQQRVQSGMYADVDVITPSMVPDPSKAAQANDKVEGRDSNAYNEDGLREVFEVYVTMELAGDDLGREPGSPYIITIDNTSTKVLSIYRNWDEDDDSQEELEWIVEFPFVPWRGAYPIGIVHMIGGLSAAATGSLRALMDSAHIQNSTGMLKLKGGTRGGQSLTMEPTEIKEIEGGLNVDDIRKLAMPLPFNPPSPTLFQLLGFVVDAAKGVVQTTMEDVADSNTEMPVGTTLSRIEQGSMVFSAIHARLHNSMQRVLSVLHRLNGMYLDDREEQEETGDLLASRADFNGPMDVVPVSDPNIFSEAQRFAQVQAVAQRAQLNPQLYNARNVEELVLSTLKIPSGKALLNPSVTPEEENAVAENVKATLGRPIVAFPQQDHIAHLKSHLSFALSPIFGSSQLMAPTALPTLVSHIKEHMVLWYASEVMATGSDVTHDLSALIGQAKSSDARKALDQLVAEANLDVLHAAPAAFNQMLPVIGQLIQHMQAVMPQPPMDPAVKVAADDVAMRGQTAQAKNQLEQAKLADADKERAFELQRDQIKEAGADERAMLSATALMESKGVDSATAKQDSVLEFAAAVHEVQTEAQTAQHGAVMDAAAQMHGAQVGADADKAVAETAAAAQPPAPGGGG